MKRIADSVLSRFRRRQGRPVNLPPDDLMVPILTGVLDHNANCGHLIRIINTLYGPRDHPIKRNVDLLRALQASVIHCMRQLLTAIDVLSEAPYAYSNFVEVFSLNGPTHYQISRMRHYVAADNQPVFEDLKAFCLMTGRIRRALKEQYAVNNPLVLFLLHYKCSSDRAQRVQYADIARALLGVNDLSDQANFRNARFPDGSSVIIMPDVMWNVYEAQIQRLEHLNFTDWQKPALIDEFMTYENRLGEVSLRTVRMFAERHHENLTLRQIDELTTDIWALVSAKLSFEGFAYRRWRDSIFYRLRMMERRGNVFQQLLHDIEVRVNQLAYPNGTF